MLRTSLILGGSLVVASVLGCIVPPANETGETETGETETGEPHDADSFCVEFCEVQDQCAPDPYFSYDDCLELCATETVAAEAAEGCPQALTEFYTCIGTLSCEQFDALYDDESGPCYANAVAFDELCYEALTCELIGGGDELGSYCTYQFDCYGSGKHRVECIDGGCVCLLDGVEVGSCDSLYPALCEPFDPTDPNQANATIVARLNECCGWMLEF